MQFTACFKLACSNGFLQYLCSVNSLELQCFEMTSEVVICLVLFFVNNVHKSVSKAEMKDVLPH